MFREVTQNLRSGNGKLTCPSSATPTAALAADQSTILSSPLVLSSPALPAPYCRGILPIPPSPALFDKCVIDVGAIQQEYISQGAPVLILAVSLKGVFFSENELRRRLLGSVAERLAFFWAVNSIQPEVLCPKLNLRTGSRGSTVASSFIG